jgi:hypothetical protein
MTQIELKTLLGKMKMTKTFKKYIQKILSMVMYIEKKYHNFLKISMAYNIGVANFGCSWFST